MYLHIQNDVFGKKTQTKLKCTRALLSRLRKVRHFISCMMLHTRLLTPGFLYRVYSLHSLLETCYWISHVARYGTTIIAFIFLLACQNHVWGLCYLLRHILWNDDPKIDKREIVTETCSITTVSHYSNTWSVCRWFTSDKSESVAMFQDCKCCGGKNLFKDLTEEFSYPFSVCLFVRWESVGCGMIEINR